MELAHARTHGFFATLLLAACLLAPSSAQDSRNAGPVPVFILCGQSNMQGHAHVRTLDVMGIDRETAPLLAKIRTSEGEPRVHEDIWISSIGCSKDEKVGRLTTGFGVEGGGPKIGPELTFGITMHELVGEPIVLIKTSWGGKSLHTDFRPPSAGAFEFREEQLEQFAKQGKDVAKIQAEKAAATGHYYRLMLEHVQAVLADLERVYPDYDAERGYELAGFVWFQGWNDMVDRGVYPQRDRPGGYDEYSRLLAHFIRDVRQDLDAPELPFVIGVMGAGGPVKHYGPGKKRYAGIHQEFRNAMAAPAKLREFKGNVTAVLTEDYWDLELDRLRTKDGELRQEVKALAEAGKLGAVSEGEALEKLRARSFSERERTILTDGVSNQEYHYLGSAKILAQIGEAFAEALAKLR